AIRTLRTDGKGNANGLKSEPSDNATIISVLASLKVARIADGKGPAEEVHALSARRSSVTIVLRLCTIVPKRKGLPSVASSLFQKSTASRRASIRESSSIDMTAIEGVSCHTTHGLRSACTRCVCAGDDRPATALTRPRMRSRLFIACHAVTGDD